MGWYASKPCVDCGRVVRRQCDNRRTWRCPDCAVIACSNAALEMAARHGPAYNAWIDGMMRWVQREAAKRASVDR